MKVIIATHGHFDHVGAISELQHRYNVNFIIHELDVQTLRRANLFAKFLNADNPIVVPKPSYLLSGEKGELNYNSLKIDWYRCPGHTPVVFV